MAFSDWLTPLYFVYTFLAFYFLFIYVLTYIQNKSRIYEFEKPERDYALSIVVPCFNVGDDVRKNVKSLLSSNYKNLKRIILVDDCSTDNTYEILKELKKLDKRIKVVQTPKNTGRAAGAKNYGAQFVTTQLIGFSDDDSVQAKDAIGKMVGYFNDPKVGAVTSRVLVANRTNRLSRIQAIEYKVMAFTRKLLGFLDSIYVTNGPLSIYRHEGFKKIGGFDMENWTEDIELTWAFVAHGWKVHMAIPAKVYTLVPQTVKTWFHQRIRWNVGGMQTINKYRKQWVNTGMLGYFIMPFFILSWFIGLTGFGLLIYRIFKHVTSRYLITKYSIGAEVALIQFDELAISPNLLFFFGMILFTLGLMYLFAALLHSREKNFPRHTLLDIFIYSIFYLLMYPPVLLYSIYKFMRGLEGWNRGND